MDYAPHTDDDVTAMLGVLGLESIDELFAQQLPADLRAPEDLGIAPGLAEADVLDRMRRLAAANTSIDDAVCWLGGGAYDHYQPAVVPAIVGKPEFATAYTPYQPEMSQGGLQALFEFQTLASEVLGLPIANSSLYDGASAIVEAVIMAVGSTGRSKVVLAGALDPRFREILRTYAPGLGVTLLEAAPGSDGTVDPQAVAELAGDAAAVVVQHPNVLGVLEDVPAIADTAHDAGAKLVVSFDLMLAGVLEPPGRLGADIVTADGLSSGNSLSFGGPGCGLLACSANEVRRLPGRLVGQTVDLENRRGFVLTLQAREQHIRREKATSNICTNQALNAMAVAVYLSWLGPQGLVELGKACLAGATYAAESLAAAGVPLAFPDSPVGKEFAVAPPDPVDVQRKLAERGHLVGPIVPVGGRDVLLVAVTEQRTRQDVDELARVFGDVVGEGAR